MHSILYAAFVDSRFRRLRYRAAMALYAMVLIFGSIPGARAEVGEFAPGVVLHSVTYAVLTILLFTGSTGGLLQRAAKSLATVMAMGALDEYVQSFFPYRTASVSDWLVDCAAALLVSLALALILSKASDRGPGDNLTAK